MSTENNQQPQFSSLREKIAFEAKQRRERYLAYAKLIEDANQAGVTAVENLDVTPMIVQQHANPMDDKSPVVKEYFVADGVCGFAWVTVYPGNSSFAQYAKKFHGWNRAYQGGMQLWVSQYGQSMQKKETYARAYAEVLRKGGIEAYSGSRLD